VTLRQQWIVIVVGFAWMVCELGLAAAILVWFKHSP
jgi:membrane protein implicated in regulation of membrane protease activity